MIHIKIVHGHFCTCYPMPTPTELEMRALGWIQTPCVPYSLRRGGLGRPLDDRLGFGIGDYVQTKADNDS